MRYLTVSLRAAESDSFYPVGKRLAEEPSVTRGRIHHVQLLADETVLVLSEGEGDRERFEEIMAAAPHVENFLVTGDQRWMATSQYVAREPVRRFLERRRRSDLVVETPIDFEPDGSVELTYLGTDSEFQELYDDINESSALEIEVVETGEYRPGTAGFMRPLTTRQREVLRVAVEEGYYRNPRAATHDDIAEVVGIAPSTVGDHLREIESRVFGALVQ